MNRKLSLHLLVSMLGFTLLAAGGIPNPSKASAVSLPPPTFPVSGNTPWITILCKFADRPDEPEPLSFYQYMYANQYPGLDHYWREASNNSINLSGSTAVGWYTLPKTFDEYLESLNTATRDCFELADPDVFYPDYYGVITILNANLTGTAWGGQAGGVVDGVYHEYKYVVFPYEGIWEQGVLQHEMGHGYGLPHSWASWNPYGNPWDVVSRNRYGCDQATHPQYGCIGQHTTAFNRYNLGWIPSDRIYTAGPGTHTLTLERATLPGPNGYLLAGVPIGGSATDFYTVEARHRTGYDAKLPGAAVIIHKISGTEHHQELVDLSLYQVGDGDSAMWLPGEAFASADHGIIIQVNSATASGFNITIINGGVEIRTKILTPAADTTLQEKTPNSNYGSSTELKVDGNNPQKWTALRFNGEDIPPATYRMTLRLPVLSSSVSSPGDVYTQSVDSVCWPGTSWAENTLTWNSLWTNNCPNYVKSYAELGHPIIAGSWVEWNLTPFGAKNGLDKIMIMDSSDPISFSSKEGAQAPQLIVDYLVPPGSATETPTKTITPSPTNTSTPSPTKTITPSSTKTVPPTPTLTPTLEQEGTASPSPTTSLTPTATSTSSAASTPSTTPSPTSIIIKSDYAVCLPLVKK